MNAQALIGGTFTIAHKIESLLPAALDVICEWVNRNDGHATHDENGIEVDTLDGPQRAILGDWVVLGINNKFAPMTHDAFIAMSKGQSVHTISEAGNDA